MVQVRGDEAQLWWDRGAGLQQARGWRATPEAVAQLGTALIAAGGRHLDELHPCVDVRLGDGIRVHAVVPPVAVSGAAVSIRLPHQAPFGFVELSLQGSATT